MTRNCFRACNYKSYQRWSLSSTHWKWISSCQTNRGFSPPILTFRSNKTINYNFWSRTQKIKTETTTFAITFALRIRNQLEKLWSTVTISLIITHFHLTLGPNEIIHFIQVFSNEIFKQEFNSTYFIINMNYIMNTYRLNSNIKLQIT